MGKVQGMDAKPSSLHELHILVRRDIADRVDAAAKAVDQSRSAWIRMAMVEKLARDGGRHGDSPAA